MSWAGENSSPGSDVVNVGSTSVSVTRVAAVASMVAVASALNVAILFLSASINREMPTRPVHAIMKAANTVSRARLADSSGEDTISVRISETSITVTASARTSEPNGSPTRCAITSA